MTSKEAKKTPKQVQERTCGDDGEVAAALTAQNWTLRNCHCPLACKNCFIAMFIRCYLRNQVGFELHACVRGMVLEVQSLQSAEVVPHSAALPSQGCWQSQNGPRNNFDISLLCSLFLCPLGSCSVLCSRRVRKLTSFLWFCITTPKLLHKNIF